MTVEDQIRELAYRKWEQAGYPAGDGVQFWVEAEQELEREYASPQRNSRKATKASPAAVKKSKK